MYFFFFCISLNLICHFSIADNIPNPSKIQSRNLRSTATKDQLVTENSNQEENVAHMTMNGSLDDDDVDDILRETDDNLDADIAWELQGFNFDNDFSKKYNIDVYNNDMSNNNNNKVMKAPHFTDERNPTNAALKTNGERDPTNAGLKTQAENVADLTMKGSLDDDDIDNILRETDDNLDADIPW